METINFQTLTYDDFPKNSFFNHLVTGTDFYQNHNYSRAIEEFAAAMLLREPAKLTLKKSEDRIAFNGDLAQVPLLFLLYTIHSNRLSGEAVLKFSQKTQKYIFKNGNIIRVRSGEHKDRIGQYILRRKILTPEEMNVQLKESIKNKEKIGTWLVKKKFIKEKTLKELVSLQIEEIFSDALYMQKGAFSFTEWFVKEPVHVQYPPLKLAWIAIHRGFNFEDFRKAIPNNRIIFKPALGVGNNKSDILQKLDANYQFIFFLVDGTRNINQLIQFSGHNESSVINILYKLSSLGLIRKTKDIQEYEDKAFDEVKMILGVLFDIYNLFINEMIAELGDYGKAIMKEKQLELDREHARVFRGIPLDKPERMTRNNILKNISHLLPFPEKKVVFIDAFIKLFRLNIVELQKRLGTGVSNRIRKNMKMIVENLERFSMDTELKSYMMRNLKKIL